MAKKKEVPLETTRDIVSETTKEKDVEIIKKETYNLIEADELQKSGWRLIDISQTSNGKIYKFER